jgi:hypothetical protein
MRKFCIYRKIEMEARRKAEEEERRRQDEEDKKLAAALQVRFFISNQPTRVMTLIWCGCWSETVLFLAAACDVHFFHLWTLKKSIHKLKTHICPPHTPHC